MYFSLTLNTRSIVRPSCFSYSESNVWRYQGSVVTSKVSQLTSHRCQTRRPLSPSSSKHVDQEFVSHNSLLSCGEYAKSEHTWQQHDAQKCHSPLGTPWRSARMARDVCLLRWYCWGLTSTSCPTHIQESTMCKLVWGWMQTSLSWSMSLWCC